MVQIQLPQILETKIGEGGSAIVYKQVVDGKERAIKVLKQQVLKRKMIQAGMKLAQLKNENIVGFIGICCRPSAFIYDFCGINIEDDIVTNVSQLLEILNDQWSFDFHQRLSIINQATLGLNYLHSMNILHRDFKLSNLLVCGSPDKINVKVSDFDDVYILKTAATTMCTGLRNMKGMTLSYVALEILNGVNISATKQSDVFSWALSSYEIMSKETSPWANNLPVMSDALLLEAYKNNARPSFEHITPLYNEKDLISSMARIITCACLLYTSPSPRDS